MFIHVIDGERILIYHKINKGEQKELHEEKVHK
jgi:hypothetical protein